MAFSPFSQIVQPAPWVDPINLDLLKQANMYKEEIARQNLSNLSESFQALASTPAYGKDAEKLQEKMQELKSQISGLNLSDVSDYNTMGQIKGVINQFSNDTDMLAIGKRGNFYKSELQKEQQYNEKGLKYRSPSKKSLEEYYNSGIYKTNPESVTFSSGWQMPDQAKIMKAAKDLVEPEITFITDAQGRRQEVKRYNPEDLKLAIEQVSNSDPNYEKELSYQFQEQYGDTDWDTYSKEEHSTLVSEAAKNKEIAKAFYQKTKDSKYLQMIEQADDVINTFSDAYDNPNSPEQTKIRVFQDFKNKQIYQAISAMDAEQKKPIAMDEIAKAKMELSNDLYKIDYKAKQEAGLISGIPGNISDLDKEIYKAAINSGKPIYDVNGNLIPAKTLASEAGVVYNPKESMDAVTSSKKEENTMPKKLKSVFETINSGTALNSTEQEDLDSYIKTNRDLLNSKGTDDIVNVRYEIENGVKVIKWEIDDWGFNTDKKAYVVNSQEEYDKVPKGEVFIDSTGKPTIKE